MQFLVNTPKCLKSPNPYKYNDYNFSVTKLQYYYIDIFYRYLYQYNILLSHCNYIVTILITTLYRYIYRYILSIKRYNSQYRYSYIYSIIRMILNNTEMYIYTVYTLHIYIINHTILVYSNFLNVYHSYLLLKQ